MLFTFLWYCKRKATNLFLQWNYFNATLTSDQYIQQFSKKFHICFPCCLYIFSGLRFDLNLIETFFNNKKKNV